MTKIFSDDWSVFTTQGLSHTGIITDDEGDRWMFRVEQLTGPFSQKGGYYDLTKVSFERESTEKRLYKVCVNSDYGCLQQSYKGKGRTEIVTNCRWKVDKISFCIEKI